MIIVIRVFWSACLPTYLLDQFVLQLFGHRLGGRQSSRYLHRPLVQVLPVPVGGPLRAGEDGAEEGEDTTHHRRATSHFHLRDNSARRGGERKRQKSWWRLEGRYDPSGADWEEGDQEKSARSV